MSSYSRTYLTNPELWDDGVSFMMKCEYATGGQAIVASGWHMRSIEFENTGIEFHRNKDGFGVIFIDTNGDIDNPWQGIQRYEFEISLDGVHKEQVDEVLSRVLRKQTAIAVVESMSQMIQRVSANKANAVVHCGSSEVIPTVDLLCQNLPARSGNMTEPLRALYRWCRIFKTPRGTVTIYQPVADNFKPNLRWPHNGIWLNRGVDYFRSKTDVGDIAKAFEIPILYEEYNLENWRIEFEFWENQPFQIIVSDSSEDAARRLGVAQKEIGVLSQFVTNAFMAARNLEHRSKHNELVTSDPQLVEIATKHIAHLKTIIEEDRRMLETASGLLANTAQSVQAVVNQENAEISERTNTFLTYASAIFFIPTLIISFFSMSIIGMNKGDAVPSTLSVFLLCLISVIVALVLLLLFRMLLTRSKKKKSTSK
ncbi:MAG: CorA family divalent cation transporter [Arcanobacterium sp.]|nr:CorA family divalent cation transporter [Arcanobacterium sp.]